VKLFRRYFSKGSQNPIYGLFFFKIRHLRLLWRGFMDNGLSFSNPNTGSLGMGAAQNAGSMLNWRAAYNKYAIDASSNGEQPVPMDEFVAQMAKSMQQQPGAQAAPRPQPGMMSGLLGRVMGR
jgi:hypothetical protein